MAAPIIQSITVSPDPVPSGQQATITVNAADPDAGTVSLSVSVTDAAGNTTQGQSTFPVSDPLTFAVTADTGTVTQDPSQPNRFFWSE